MSNLRHQFVRVSHHLTRLIAVRYGTSFPFTYVIEYPKSGGTWLARMVADALQLPFPQHAVLPLGFAAVVQAHWGYHPKLRRVIYLSRDGRDVIVSFYFYRMNALAACKPATVKAYRDRYERLFGRGYDPQDTERHLPRFIEDELARPRASRLTWADHVDAWHGPDGRPGVTYVTYEALRADCAQALGEVLASVAERPLDPWIIETTVEKLSMARQTGRRPGEEDRASFIRKGVVGDWVNHFSREAAEVFDAAAGEQLVALGYEPDRTWASRHERGTTPANRTVPA